MKFIDLFAGLGGFHIALKELGHQCVFACEKDPILRELYMKNFNIEAEGDIQNININIIPPHDILCAGFPCQPFSKAGYQKGLKDPESGTLFYEIEKIINQFKPEYLILENVTNLERHDGGKTWKKMATILKSAGYSIDNHKLSPHLFGIPQIRERMYIVGSRHSLNGFKWPEPTKVDISIKTILDKNPIDSRKISKNVKKCINVWQDFLDKCPSSIKLPSFPIWTMEFGANYPYKDKTPYKMKRSELKKYRGSHGFSLCGNTWDDISKGLPSYARSKEPKFPQWKIKFIEQNREFYQHNSKWIDRWLPSILPFPSSFQKLEWNCLGEPRQISRYIIQMRASGVRVKRTTTSPSLVAMTATQVPIIGWEGRYITPNECKRLQSMDSLAYFPSNLEQAYKALGNAVNVYIVKLVARSLFNRNTVQNMTVERERLAV